LELVLFVRRQGVGATLDLILRLSIGDSTWLDGSPLSLAEWGLDSATGVSGLLTGVARDEVRLGRDGAVLAALGRDVDPAAQLRGSRSTVTALALDAGSIGVAALGVGPVTLGAFDLRLRVTGRGVALGGVSGSEQGGGEEPAGEGGVVHM
jgi:hypothetical protein